MQAKSSRHHKVLAVGHIPTLRYSVLTDGAGIRRLDFSRGGVRAPLVAGSDGSDSLTARLKWSMVARAGALSVISSSWVMRIGPVRTRLVSATTGTMPNRLI